MVHPPSPPAALVSLRTCVQGTAAATAGPLGSAPGLLPRLSPGSERAAASVGSAVRGVTAGPKISGDAGRLCGVPIESESVVQDLRLCCIRMFENLLTSFSA
ncbi:hypothetical protein NDU88_006529 [Pleurodeles waltl]|uniref:Secreted protein n=1 Tax=Pleurodeles waltl TaxID=8319 RepID=A0AAV7VN01_PLEWA|nr:hypothetical protein NDU88_006529 [Pleurodeles waltl]